MGRFENFQIESAMPAHCSSTRKLSQMTQTINNLTALTGTAYRPLSLCIIRR